MNDKKEPYIVFSENNGRSMSNKGLRTGGKIGTKYHVSSGMRIYISSAAHKLLDNCLSLDITEMNGVISICESTIDSVNPKKIKKENGQTTFRPREHFEINKKYFGEFEEKTGTVYFDLNQ